MNKIIIFKTNINYKTKQIKIKEHSLNISNYKANILPQICKLKHK